MKDLVKKKISTDFNSTTLECSSSNPCLVEI